MSGNEIITNKTSSGLAYQVYVPDNVNSNTPIIFYHHGSGGYPHDYNALNKHLESVGSNAIVVEYNHYNRQDTALPMEILADVSSRYNVPATNFRTAGFSYGLEPALRSMASVIQQNPNMEPQSVILVDGYWSGNTYVASDSNVLSTLANNDTVIFAIHQANITCNDPYYKDWITKYGMKMIRLDDHTCGFNGSPNAHLGANNNYVWQGLLNFQSGIGRFPPESAYTAQIFNGSEWVDVSIAGKTLDQVYEMVGMDTFALRVEQLSTLSTVKIASISVSSDSSVLKTNINNVINKIKTSNFVQNNIRLNGGFGGSTSNIPTQIPSVVSSFFSASSRFLVTLANDMNSIAQIGDSIDKLNQKLALLAGDVNGPVIPNEDKPADEVIRDENPEENKPEENKPEENKPEENKPEENKPEENKPEENKPQQSAPQQSKPQQSKPQQTTPQQSKPNVTPNYNNSGNSGNSGNSNNSNTNQYVTESGNSVVIENHPLNEFPKYEDVYSNDNRIVYNFDDKYKIVIHTDGDKIIGIEHYYDFESQFNADKALDDLMLTYSNDNNLENIVQDDRYVKVIFDEKSYSGLTISDIRKRYSNLKEIVRL